jgi:GT2 family glycosyltransferase
MRTPAYEFSRLVGRLSRSFKKRARRLAGIRPREIPVSVPQIVPEIDLNRNARRRDIRIAEDAFAAGDWLKAKTAWEFLEAEYGDWLHTASFARYHASICDRLINAEQYRRSLGRYDAPFPEGLRICIYTAIVDGYDTVKLPRHVNTRINYVLFSNSATDGFGLWDVRPLQYHEEDATRSARYVKTHPHHLLDDCDIAIWVDSNIMILDKLEDMIVSFIGSGMPIAGVPHPHRYTLAEEAEACALLKKDDVETLNAQLRCYRDEGFDRGDLLETNLMMFDLRQKECRSFLDLWWQEISRWSRRDQLSVGYALSRSGSAIHLLTQRPHSVRDHPMFGLVPHDFGRGAVEVLLSALAPSSVAVRPVPYAAVRRERLAAVDDTPIDIVVCVHNALDDVALCLASIEAKRRAGHRLIVVDDGSSSETAGFVASYCSDRPWSRAVRNEAVIGYTRAANLGLSQTTASFVILLNSDTIVTDNWAEKMADAVFSTPGAGIVGPMSNAASHQSLPEHVGTAGQTAINPLPPGFTPDAMNSWCERQVGAAHLPRVPLAHGFCLGLTRQAIETVGLFDEESFPHGYGEENDYCFRATNAGVGIVLATHTFVFHAKSKSYASETRVRLMAAGSQVFKNRHGMSRVQRSVRAMQTHPELVRLREEAKGLFGDRHN